MQNDTLLTRVKALKLYGLIAHWGEIKTETWVSQIITWEEHERSHLGLTRRLHNAHLGKFKLLANFDWSWPKRCDRYIIEELMQLDFIKAQANIIICGPNGVGKSTIACNIGYQAVIAGYTVLFVTASGMLNDLLAQDGDNALRRRIKYYAKQAVLIVDELGYLSYSNRHADLLFEIVSQRYEKRPTIITTNKPFTEWGEIFANASCVVSIVDRLIHNSEIISIEAESYRCKEAKENAINKKQARAIQKKSKLSTN